MLINVFDPQVLPHTSLPDHEEEQPLDPHPAAGGPGHPPQSLCEIWSVPSKKLAGKPAIRFLLTSATAFGKEKSESLEGTLWQSNWQSNWLEREANHQLAGLSDKQIEEAVTKLVKE